MKPTLKKTLSYLIQTLIVGLIFYILVRNLLGNWQLVRDGIGRFQLWWLVPTTLLIGLAFLMLVETWRRVLKGTGASLGFTAVCKLWFASNMAKYLPGKVWQILGIVYLAERRGIPKLQSLSAAVVAQFFSVVAGLLLMVIFFGFRGYVELAGWSWLVQALSIVLILTCLVFILAPRVLEHGLNSLLRLFRKQPVKFFFNARRNMTYLLLFGLCWLVFGAALLAFVAGLSDIGIGSYWRVTGSFSGAFVLGFLALVVPAGLGVREGVLAVLLSSTIPLPVATLVALLYRLWFTLVEVALFGISFLIRE